MRNIRLAFGLLAVLCVIPGCSQTGGVRLGNPSGMRTVASVGDKPLPSVSGEPGASLRASVDDLDLPSTSGARISGRVYDERGKPVPNAKVRLAVTSKPAGKVIYATTDRSGAFTLRGVRPGSSYAVIAEYQGEDGIMTGRTQAKAPQVDVRISLRPRADEGQGHASIEPARTRIEPISNIDSADDDTRDSTRSDGSVNSEDLDLPTDAGALAAPRRNMRLSRTTTDQSSASGRGGWNSRQVTADGARIPKTKAHSSSEVTPPPVSHSAATDDSGAEIDDDGPNPLPPALDTTEVSSSRARNLSQERPVKVARRSTKSRAPRGGRTSSRAIAEDDDKAIGIRDGVRERAPRSMPEDVVPGGKVITPGSFAPIVIDGDSADDSPPSRMPDRVRTPGSGRRNATSNQGRSTNRPDDANSSDPPSPDDSQTSRGTDRPTWGQVTLKQSAVPLDESILRTAGEPSADRPDAATLTSKPSTPKPGRSRFLRASRTPVEEPAELPVCRFDPSTRTLSDFKLPNLDGTMVSMRDFDADVILLDFWGSWCGPCRTSIPHLVELQRTLGAKRLRVIGIACEKGTSPQDRRASASNAVKALGINYPVLLSSKQGNCPLQQALQVQFYPTMVLLDRNGKLLAREQGATEVTMSRMDRAIDAALRNQHRRETERTHHPLTRPSRQRLRGRAKKWVILAEPKESVSIQEQRHSMYSLKSSNGASKSGAIQNSGFR